MAKTSMLTTATTNTSSSAVAVTGDFCISVVGTLPGGSRGAKIKLQTRETGGSAWAEPLESEMVFVQTGGRRYFFIGEVRAVLYDVVSGDGTSVSVYLES